MEQTELQNKVIEQMVKEVVNTLNEELAEAPKFVPMDDWEIAFKYGNTVYKTDVPTVLLGGAIAAGVGFGVYTLAKSLL